MEARRTGVREGKARLNKLGGPAEGRLVDLVRGYRLSQAVSVVTQFGIPDLLANGPREIDDLAHATASHAPTLYRILRALAGAGLFEEILDHANSIHPHEAERNISYSLVMECL